jgi:putative tricarboxylic transport membrane protein
MEKSRIQDLVIGVVCAAIGIWAWIVSLSFPETTQVYTHVALIAFIGLSVILIIWSLVNAKKPGGEVVNVATFKSPMLTFIIILAYVLLLDKIGFFVCSAVFMLGFMWFMGYRKPLTMVLTTVGMLGFIYLLFVFELHVSLPDGILF